LLREKLKGGTVSAKDAEFVSKLVATAVGVGTESELVSAIQALAPATDVPADAEAGAKLEPWRLEAMAALLDGLRRQGGDLNSLRAKLDAEGQTGLARMDSVLRRACKVVMEPAADEALHRSAIRLLGAWDHKDGLAALFDGLLQTSLPPSLQSAAIDALAKSRQGGAGERLVREWNHLSPGIRGRALDALLSRAEWTGGLVGALERGDIRGSEVSAAQRQRLLALKDAGLRERTEKIFSNDASASRAEVLGRFQNIARLTGRAEQGSLVFEKNCAQCHAMRGRGHEVGPNLAEFAGKSIQDFVLAIFDPNAGINPNFVAYNVETKDGRSLSGIVRDETAGGLALVQGGGLRETILRSDIAGIRASALSLMPEGLEQAMTPQDVADLVAWLKGATPAVFGSASAEAAAKARAEFLKEGMNGLAEVTASVESLPYPSWLGRQPMAYCRQNAGQVRLAWRTKPVPAMPGDKVTFRLPAAMGFVSQPGGKFTLKLNGKPEIDFDVTLADRIWDSADGKVRMSYLVKEANSEDSAGVLLVEVNASLLAADKPAEFEVVGSSSNSQRWFGIYVLENVATARR
jgi:putative heme-binding domain-containing protein